VQPLTLTKLLVEVVIAIIALAGMVAASPLLVSKARLLRERDEARREADSLRDLVAAFETGLSALDHLREEVVEIRAVQIISTRYVADLVAHIRDGRSAETMPEIPAELRDEVLDVLRHGPRVTHVPTAPDRPS
jgi:alkylhydroperoxidase family enzyme